MGLFDRPSGSGTPFNWIVVGLGNPGESYRHTRHNVGQDCVELLAQRHGTPLRGGRDHALVAETRWGLPGDLDAERVVLACPVTYMNESGRSVAALVRRYQIDDPSRIIIVHDELDLEPGVIRIKDGGGLAGHNGLRSITQHLGTQDYRRVRIGVGKPPSKERGARHVLSRIPRSQREIINTAVAEAADAVDMVITEGIDQAMQTYHAR
ncbi:MAG: aminoacyl-tRNA hydrolase [Ilumatobacter coccineus]|uniref:Peptidyl-tRNA hydrolase n=1 Tax=Ilumatobacter coccineus TaxID=467094 RepID=A0A2G6KHI1_9ACTN|nr:MAG: aminoacyl-tRNA hydrolase [Ilumatobacter coccineus]